MMGYTPEGLACAPTSTDSSTLPALDLDTKMPEEVHAPMALLRAPLPICPAFRVPLLDLPVSFRAVCFVFCLSWVWENLGGALPTDANTDAGVDAGTPRRRTPDEGCTIARSRSSC